MLCYRCGSHVQDGAEKCWNCGTVLTSRKAQDRPSTTELRAQQRTGSRMFGVVYKIGDLIANRYRVKDIAGSGGAGVVYRARDQEIDVDVAVKVINAKLVQTSDEQRLFSRQTKIARKLSHQNVVRLYDEGRDEQRPYFTMQFLEGLSLRKIIDLRKEKKQTFAISEVEPIFNQLCQALDYAHKTTFHGNLKPDNVIVLPDLLKVTDFALLRGLPRKPFLAIQKSRGVNFRYLAPEVRLEVPDLEKSIDVYSLGVILSEMLTGTVYDEAKAEQLTLAGSGLDPAVLNVLKRCLARAPKDRYHSAKDLYEDIRSAMTKGGAGRRPMPPPPPEQHPANAAEAPTQRLDITKHGARPVEEPAAGPSEPRPAPVEVAASVNLGEEPPARREATASFEIDDDMIEGFEAHKSEGAAAKGPPSAATKAPPPVPAPEPVAPSDVAVAAAPVEEDLQDDPNPPVAMDDEEETQAILDPEPIVTGRAAAAAVTVDAVELQLDEISNSAIELISDPRATNVLRVDRDRQRVEPTISEPPPAVTRSNGAGHQTLQPTPLPDSALPEPAFVSAVSRDATQHGRLDGPGEAAPSVPRSPTLGFGEPAPSNGAHGSASDARPAKKRPMTRPRMPTIQPSAIPMVSTVPSSVRPQTMPAVGASTIPPDAGFTALPPPPSNRPLYFTLAASIGTVVLALLIVLKVNCDQQVAATQQIAALTQQMQQMQNLAETARENQQKLEAEAEAQGVEVAAATKAEAEAAVAAEAEAKAKAEAEAEALRRAEEAARAEQAARAEAGAKAKAEAEARAKEAKRLADEQRRTADAAAARESAANAKVEAERKRREEAQRLKDDKERRAREEAAAAKKAEERAERLAEEQAKRRSAEDAASAAEERRQDEARRREEAKRKADEIKRAAEEAKQAEAAKKAEEAKKVEEPSLAAATESGAGPKCPRGMVLVPAGAFMMGSARNDPERNFGDLAYASTEVAGFCMDYYEYPNGRGLAPKTGMNFKAALGACKKKGKRLCTEAEWEKACKGAAGTRYPYGNQWDPTRCNTEDEEGSDREVAKSGTFRKCYSGFKVFDLSGNVGEWTGTEWGSGYVVKGGASDRPGYDGRCAARKKKTSTSSADTLGFRCCSDPE